VSLAYPVSAVIRQLGMFIPLWAVLTGAGLARIACALGPRMRALVAVGAAGLLIALPVLTGAVRLQPGRPFRAAMLTADALRDGMGPDDLLHAGAPDSSVIVFFMGAEQYHRALDAILVRNAWQQSDGDLWMVVRARRSSLEGELGRLRGYRADGRFSSPERVFHGGIFTVYRLQRR
jgi:hypothetical protein